MGHKASKTMAKLYRQQYDDYVKRFGPKEEELVAAYGNAGLRRERISEAKRLSNQGFANAAVAENVNRSRYGISMSPQEQTDHDRRFKLSRSLANVDVSNKTRRHIVDRDQAMLTGGMSGFLKKKGQI